MALEDEPKTRNQHREEARSSMMIAWDDELADGRRTDLLLDAIAHALLALSAPTEDEG
jgi:hypothetical protein